MKYIYLMLSILLFVACAKDPSPKRVKNKLQKGTWQVVEFYYEGTDTTNMFDQFRFGFEEEGSIMIFGNESIKASWEVSLNKKPTILYLTFPAENNLEFLSDEWIVNKITNDVCNLTRKSEKSLSDRLSLKKTN
jgi:hypothetical protein